MYKKHIFAGLDIHDHTWSVRVELASDIVLGLRLKWNISEPKTTVHKKKQKRLSTIWLKEIIGEFRLVRFTLLNVHLRFTIVLDSQRSLICSEHFKRRSSNWYWCSHSLISVIRSFHHWKKGDTRSRVSYKKLSYCRVSSSPRLMWRCFNLFQKPAAVSHD